MTPCGVSSVGVRALDGYAPAVKEGWLDARFASPVVRIGIMDRSGVMRPQACSDTSPPSINDNLPSSNPSGKTVLIVLGCALVLVGVLVLFHSTFRF